MAENKGKGIPQVKDLTWWYSDINFVPSQDKNALWMAQICFYWKQNAVKLLDNKRYDKYRKLDLLEINEKEYRELLDPKTAMGGGGTAEYIAADFKEIPIAIHLENLLREKLDKLGDIFQLQVNEIDKYAKSQKERDADQIIYQREFRNLINEVNQQLGLPPIKENQTPYEYVKSLQGDSEEKVVSGVDTILDYIRSQIQDEQDLVLYQTFIYKGDLERAFELGIQHYLINLNKWSVNCQKFHNDIKHFNRFCGEWYIDETTGRGTLKYLPPNILWTSQFNSFNGEDIVAWFYEEDITFADFVRMFGMNLDDRALKEVFELNKWQGNDWSGGHGMEWGSVGNYKGSNAKIRIGKMSILTQDADQFSEKYVNNKIQSWMPKKLSWLPDERSDDTIKNKIYNVWYSFYYVPPPGDRLRSNKQIDWAWQSRFIFNIKKEIDMYRWGVDMRYAKSSLVVWKDDTRPSFTDVKEAYMTKIRPLWYKFQNCIINDYNGVSISTDLITGMLKAVDENNKIRTDNPDKGTGGNGVDAGLTAFRMLKQGGMGFFSFRDKLTGKMIDEPQKLFINVDNKMMEKAELYLKKILELYNLLTMSLAQNDVSQGAGVKSHTTNEGVQASLMTASRGEWYCEKPARELLVMYGERCVQFLLNVIKDKKLYGFLQRFEELQNVIGKANAMMLEGIEGIEPQDIGISVSLENTEDMKAYYEQLTTQMVRDKEIDIQDVEMIMSSLQHNYKYGAILLTLAAKKKAKEKADQEELAHMRAMQLEQERQKTVMAMQQAKTQGKIQEMQTEYNLEAKLQEIIAMLKGDHQHNLTDWRTQNKIAQDNNKSELKQKEENQKPFELAGA